MMLLRGGRGRDGFDVSSEYPGYRRGDCAYYAWRDGGDPGRGVDAPPFLTTGGSSSSFDHTNYLDRTRPGAVRERRHPEGTTVIESDLYEDCTAVVPRHWAGEDESLGSVVQGLQRQYDRQFRQLERCILQIMDERAKDVESREKRAELQGSVNGLLDEVQGLTKRAEGVDERMWAQASRVEESTRQQVRELEQQLQAIDHKARLATTTVEGAQERQSVKLRRAEHFLEEQAWRVSRLEEDFGRLRLPVSGEQPSNVEPRLGTLEQQQLMLDAKLESLQALLEDFAPDAPATSGDLSPHAPQLEQSLHAVEKSLERLSQELRSQLEEHSSLIATLKVKVDSQTQRSEVLAERVELVHVPAAEALRADMVQQRSNDLRETDERFGAVDQKIDRASDRLEDSISDLRDGLQKAQASINALNARPDEHEVLHSLADQCQAHDELLRELSSKAVDASAKLESLQALLEDFAPDASAKSEDLSPHAPQLEQSLHAVEKSLERLSEELRSQLEEHSSLIATLKVKVDSQTQRSEVLAERVELVHVPAVEALRTDMVQQRSNDLRETDERFGAVDQKIDRASDRLEALELCIPKDAISDLRDGLQKAHASINTLNARPDEHELLHSLADQCQAHEELLQELGSKAVAEKEARENSRDSSKDLEELRAALGVLSEQVRELGSKADAEKEARENSRDSNKDLEELRAALGVLSEQVKQMAERERESAQSISEQSKNVQKSTEIVEDVQEVRAALQELGEQVMRMTEKEKESISELQNEVKTRSNISCLTDEVANLASRLTSLEEYRGTEESHERTPGGSKPKEKPPMLPKEAMQGGSDLIGEQLQDKLDRIANHLEAVDDLQERVEVLEIAKQTQENQQSSPSKSPAFFAGEIKQLRADLQAQVRADVAALSQRLQGLENTFASRTDAPTVPRLDLKRVESPSQTKSNETTTPNKVGLTTPNKVGLASDHSKGGDSGGDLESSKGGDLDYSMTNDDFAMSQTNDDELDFSLTVTEMSGTLPDISSQTGERAKQEKPSELPAIKRRPVQLQLDPDEDSGQPSARSGTGSRPLSPVAEDRPLTKAIASSKLSDADTSKSLSASATGCEFSISQDVSVEDSMVLEQCDHMESIMPVSPARNAKGIMSVSPGPAKGNKDFLAPQTSAGVAGKHLEPLGSSKAQQKAPPPASPVGLGGGLLGHLPEIRTQKKPFDAHLGLPAGIDEDFDEDSCPEEIEEIEGDSFDEMESSITM